eukprot:gene25717-biopygen19513
MTYTCFASTVVGPSDSLPEITSLDTTIEKGDKSLVPGACGWGGPTGLAKITSPDTGNRKSDKSYLERSHSDLSNAAKILSFGSESTSK